MIPTAPRLDRIKPSPSGTMSQRARDLRAAGVDVITLSSGEPDFDTPEHIVDAAAAAMRGGQTRYTNIDGTPALKQAIIGKFERENHLHYKPEEIIIGTGAKQVIFNAFMASLAPGDEVIIPAPHWVSYTDITLLAEGVPVVLPCAQNHGFRLQPGDLAAAITPRTRWLMLNSPNNPTGSVYTREDLAALAEVLRQHPQVAIMTDDIYEHLLFDGRAFVTMAEVAPDLKPRTLTINGCSKAYAMTGWRIGYAGGPANLIKAMTKLQSQSTGPTSSISQAAAVAALNGPQDFIPVRAAAFQERRDLVLGWLGRVKGLTCYRPEGAFYVYVGCAGLLGQKLPDGGTIETDTDVALYLLEHRVAVVQGAAYGLSPYFRISIATSTALLEEACARIAAACAALT
jgi:aspartate aminotransferase